MKISAVFFAVALVTTGCVSTPKTPFATIADLPGEELIVARAFFATQFPPRESKDMPGFLRTLIIGRQADTPAGSRSHVFLTIKKKDPDEALLREFSRDDLVLRIGSRFKIGEGVHFEISSISITGDRAEVSGGFFVDGLFARFGTYVLNKKDGVWVKGETLVELISDVMSAPQHPLESASLISG